MRSTFMDNQNVNLKIKKFKNVDVVALNNKALCLTSSRGMFDSIKLLEGVLQRVPIVVWNETLVMILCSMYELAYVNHEMSRKLSTIGLLKLTRRWSSSLYKKCIRDSKMNKNNVHDVMLRSMEEVPSAHKCGSVLRSNAQPWSDAGPSDLVARLERDSVMSRHVHGGAALICFLYILQRIYSRGSSSELPRYHANTGLVQSVGLALPSTRLEGEACDVNEA
ncbi:hypothetical protein ZIOFF_023022 [Zingiber officinale]|uniref:Uncharacterized protein n=1 Tax=Zingiber officinale TaxID=94328 RepID=A0A8J5LKL6_ZINOF|nr:hypothetical protein ZIOFF_023022 [Zingiber officinale]